MLKHQKKDKFKLQSFRENELIYIILNFILKHHKVRKFLKWFCLNKLSIPLKTRVASVNRCVISGRSRGVYNFAFLSRHFLRENSFVNKLPGLKKSYW